jgi:hypothetical protein
MKRDGEQRARKDGVCGECASVCVECVVSGVRRAQNFIGKNERPPAVPHILFAFSREPI